MGDTALPSGPADDDTVLAPGSPTGDPLWDDWDVPPRVPTVPVLHLDGFDGPMDQLLDLVERKRVDFGRMSPVAIADQLIAAMDTLAHIVSLDRRADWIIMGARLVHLRSRLLLPASPAAAAAAERDLTKTVKLLEERAFMRAAAAWLERRSQLGRDVFTRPAVKDPRVANYMALMEACLTVLSRRSGQPEATAATYRPRVWVFWTTAQAAAHLRARLAEAPGGGALTDFVPGFAEAPDRISKVRAAIASTLVAGLELAKGGEVKLDQADAWCPIAISSSFHDQRLAGEEVVV